MNKRGHSLESDNSATRKGDKSGAGTKRLNVDFPEDTYFRLKQLALDRRITVSDLVREVMGDFMSKQS